MVVARHAHAGPPAAASRARPARRRAARRRPAPRPSCGAARAAARSGCRGLNSWKPSAGSVSCSGMCECPKTTASACGKRRRIRPSRPCAGPASWMTASRAPPPPPPPPPSSSSSSSSGSAARSAGSSTLPWTAATSPYPRSCSSTLHAHEVAGVHDQVGRPQRRHARRRQLRARPWACGCRRRSRAASADDAPARPRNAKGPHQAGLHEEAPGRIRTCDLLLRRSTGAVAAYAEARAVLPGSGRTSWRGRR